MQLQRNLGLVDRVARVIAGGLAVWGGIAAGPGSWLGVLALVVAGVLLATAAAGFCPLYRLLRLSTRPRRLASV